MTDSFLLRILDMALAEIPSSRSLVLIHDDHHRPRPKMSRNIDWAEEHDICRDIVDSALKTGNPLLIQNLQNHPLFQEHPFVTEKRLTSVLCLPLLAEKRPRGVVYMDRTTAQPPFSGSDLEFVVSAAGFLNHLLGAASRLNPSGNGDDKGRLPHFFGLDGALHRVGALVEKVKDTGTPVFISGESGTGKELVARTIHEAGLRRSGRFVAVNCGAIPDLLLESELFGYARGAFTGAARDKTGLIEEADGGTFFLDEIGDLSFPLQAKLLRVLEERTIRRLGETRNRLVDVRFLSATNKDIGKEVREGRFREDLYYRLNIIAIELPPLRERKDDILPLINRFLEKYAREMKRPRPYFSPASLEMLLHYSWPGNVRELQNEIQHCLVMAGESLLIREEFLSSRINPRRESYSESTRNFFRAKADFEKRFLGEALARCRYHKTRTATEIGMTRQGLFKLMKKHQIRRSG